MTNRWWYLQNKQKLGPLTLEEMRILLTSGRLQPVDMIWQEGTPKWVPASSVAKSPAESSPSQTSVVEQNGSHLGNQFASFKRRLSDEVKATARATWNATAELAMKLNGTLQQRTLARAVGAAQLDLGQRLCEIGVGDEQTRFQVAALDDKLRIIKDARGSTRALAAEKDEMLLRLAIAALAEKKSPAGAEKEYEAAVSAELRLQQHHQQHSAVSSQRPGWGRALLGFAVVVCLVAVTLVAVNGFVADDSPTLQGEANSGTAIAQSTEAKTDEELSKSVIPGKKSVGDESDGSDQKPHTKDKEPGKNNSLNKDTMTVVAEGIGTTGDEALKDAFRNAVRQVVGALVDSETVVKDDEVISDKVLAYSHGFVQTYKLLSKVQDDGLHRLRIEARVERRSIVGKLKEAKISVKNIDGRGLFAEFVTQEEAKRNAKGLIDKSLDGFPWGIIRAEVNGKPTITPAGANAQVQVTVHIEPDLGKYTAFVAGFQPTLEKIAFAKGEFAFTSKAPKVTATKQTESIRTGKPKKTKLPPSQSLQVPFKAKQWVERMPNALEPKKRKVGAPTLKAKAGQVVVALCAHRTAEGDRMAWNYYAIDESIRHSLIALARQQFRLKCVFLSESGKAIAVNEQRGSVQSISYPSLSFPWGRTQDIEKEGLFLFAPVFRHGDEHTFVHYLPGMQIPVSIRLSLDEIKQISKIECQLIR